MLQWKLSCSKGCPLPSAWEIPPAQGCLPLLLLRSEPGGSHTDGSALSALADGKHAIVCRDLDLAVKTVGSTTDPRHPQTSHATLAVLPRGPQEMCRF